MITVPPGLRGVFAGAEETPRVRLQGVTFLILLILCGLAAYLYASLRFLPELGLFMLAGCGCLAALLWAGPGVTFPLYFATWFGTALALPGIPVSLNRVAAAGFLLSALAHLIRRPFRVPLAAAPVLHILLTFHAVGMGLLLKPAGAPPSVQQVFYLVTALLVASAFRTRSDLKRLLGVMLFITCVLTSVGLAEFVLRRDLFPQFSDNTLHAFNLRINGISKNAIQFAFNACWMIPWALFLAAESKTRFGRRLSLGALLLLVTASILTYNRQTPVILAAIIVTGLFLLRSPVRRRLVLLLAAVTLVTAPFLTVRIVQRFEGLSEHGSRDISLAARQDKFGIAMNMVRESPWTGVGLDNFKFYWYERRVIGEQYRLHFDKGMQQYVDLGYVQILTEAGVVGFSLFVLLILFSALLWRRCRRRALAGEDLFCANGLAAVAAGFVQLGVSLLIQDTFFLPHTYLLFGLFFCLVLIVRSEAPACEPAQSRTAAS